MAGVRGNDMGILEEGPGDILTRMSFAVRVLGPKQFLGLSLCSSVLFTSLQSKTVVLTLGELRVYLDTAWVRHGLVRSNRGRACEVLLTQEQIWKDQGPSIGDDRTPWI